MAIVAVDDNIEAAETLPATDSHLNAMLSPFAETLVVESDDTLLDGDGDTLIDASDRTATVVETYVDTLIGGAVFVGNGTRLGGDKVDQQWSDRLVSHHALTSDPENARRKKYKAKHKSD